MYAEIYKTPRTYSRLTPVKVATAESRARELYRRFDRLVNSAEGMTIDEYQSHKTLINVAYEEYKAAQDKADRLRRAYTADPNPARWFEVQNG